MTKILRKKDGFSLIEMAIALLVIAVMAGVVFIATKPMQDSANVRYFGEQLNQIQAAAVQHVQKNNGYPTALSQASFLEFLPTAPDATKIAYVCDAATSARVQAITVDDEMNVKVGQDYTRVLGAAKVTVTPKSGSTPPSVTGVLALAPTCIP